MVSVPEAVDKIIKRSRYLSEAISKGIINTSALAEYIKPEVEEILFRKVSKSSIVMAIRRVNLNTKVPRYKRILNSSPEMIVRSNLHIIYVLNFEGLSEILSEITKSDNGNYFLNITQGSTETAIIASDRLVKGIKVLLGNHKISLEFSNLSAITLKLPQDTMVTPGVYYFFLKSIAWEEINLIEIISSYQELTLVFEDKEINRVFAILKSLFV